MLSILLGPVRVPWRRGLSGSDKLSWRGQDAVLGTIEIALLITVLSKECSKVLHLKGPVSFPLPITATVLVGLGGQGCESKGLVGIVKDSVRTRGEQGGAKREA